MERYRIVLLGLVVALGVSLMARAEEPKAADAKTNKEQIEALRKEIAQLERQMKGGKQIDADAMERADHLAGSGYGPNETVLSRAGAVTMGGLLQVWFYQIANDTYTWTDANQINAGSPAGFGSNEANDNDGFRVRRSELRFTIAIHENVTAHVMIDPAREATSFPSLPQNQSSVISGDGVAFADDGTAGLLATGVPQGVRTLEVRSGTGNANRLLQDAYIHYHGIIPHHDGKVGQMKRMLGEEGTRDSSQLDFVERAMITQLADMRDIGTQVHGTWWDDRLQYWVGFFNGSGTAFQQHQNRSDTNDEKDGVASILLRPLWKDEKWGSIEIGYSIMYGKGGEAAGHQPSVNPTDGLNRDSTIHSLQYAWLMYKPGGPVRGWWIRSEWGKYRDRFAPGDLYGIGTDPAPFSIDGWYVSTGYKLSDSRWADALSNGGLLQKQLLLPMEFAFRYEVMQNLFFNDELNPTRQQDIWKTQVITAGINYYIKGHNAKLQLNYNVVVEDDDDDIDGGFQQFREVKNNNFVVNFQVAW